MTKICIKCEKEKELKEFRKRKKSKDGYGNQCNPCLNDIAKIRHNNLSEEEKKQKRIRKNERNKEYLKSNPEFKFENVGDYYNGYSQWKEILNEIISI